MIGTFIHAHNLEFHAGVNNIHSNIPSNSPPQKATHTHTHTKLAIDVSLSTSHKHLHEEKSVIQIFPSSSKSFLLK